MFTEIRRTSLTVFASVSLVVAGAHLISAQLRSAPQKLFVEHPVTWFEDVGSCARISPDGKWAIYGLPGRLKLIELSSGREDSERLSGGLDSIRSAVFYGDDLARLGRRGRERGWFLPSHSGLQLSSIPFDAMPEWSPDSSRVAFYRSTELEQPKIYVGTSEKQESFRLEGRPTTLVWSPDGRMVYLTLSDERGDTSLVRFTVADGKLETIQRDMDANLLFPHTMGISSNGRYIYLGLASPNNPNNEARHRPDMDRYLDVYEMDLKTGARRVVVKSPVDDFAPTVRNGYLYWTRATVHDAIVVAHAAGGAVHVVVEGGSVPSWHPSGRQLAFTYGGWRIADWALNLDAGLIGIKANGEADSKPKPFITGWHEDFTPSWSPDGKWIAYHSHRSPTPVPMYTSSGSADDIWLRPALAGTTEETRLTDYGWEAGPADWSPDGRKLVFCSWEKGGQPGISVAWVVTIDPLRGRALSHEKLALPQPIKNAEMAAWSPKGDEIAIEEKTSDDQHTIWVISIAGNRAEKIIEYPMATYGGLDWTPDGKNIVYAALADGRMQIFSIPRTSGQAKQLAPKKLTNETDNLFLPQVSPDGRWIACTRIQRTKEIWRVKLSDLMVRYRALVPSHWRSAR